MNEAHAEGEVGRIVTSGVLDIPGPTKLDKTRHLNEVDDSIARHFSIRRFKGRAA